MSEAAGLLTRGSLSHRLPGLAASGVVVGEHLPLQRRDRPGLSPGSLTALRCGAGAYHAPVSESRLGLWLPVLAWCAVIFAFSAVPSLGTGLGTWDLVLRKLAHVTEYAILGALLARATGRPPLAIALALAYAITDEIHQTFVPGRAGRPLDVAIDAVGIGLGVMAWQRLGRGSRLAP